MSRQHGRSGIARTVQSSSSSSNDSIACLSSPSTLATASSRRTNEKERSGMEIGISELYMYVASSPQPVFALRNVKVAAVACGAYHSLCLSADGVVYSWGRAANGRLGQFAHREIVPEPSMCEPGLVRCSWKSRQLPQGRIASPNLGVEDKQHRQHLCDSVSGHAQDRGSRVVHIAAGHSHSMAVAEDGAVFSWGCGTFGRLGHGSHCDEYLPKQV